MSKERVVVLHGWNCEARDLHEHLSGPLHDAGFEPLYVDYDSTNDQARLTDFSEMLSRALSEDSRGLLRSRLHFLTHSTGALVLRQWLARDAIKDGVIDQVGNVVMLAPVNFGSPLAPLGNKWFFKLSKARNKFNVGKQVLEALEVGSELQWDLAEQDLFPFDAEQSVRYDEEGIRLSVITGSRGYGGIRKVVNQDGTDGTIVVAGANLNARRLRLKFRPKPDGSVDNCRQWTESSIDPPFALHGTHDHSSIYKLDADRQPDVDNKRRNQVETLRDQVITALKGEVTYTKLYKQFEDFTSNERTEHGIRSYKQLVCRVMDQHWVRTPGAIVLLDVCRRSQEQGEIAVSGTRDKGRTARLQKLLRANRHVHSTAKYMQRFLLPVKEVVDIVGEDHVVALGLEIESGDTKISYSTDTMPNVVIYDPQADGPLRTDLVEPETTTLVDVLVDRTNALVRLAEMES